MRNLLPVPFLIICAFFTVLGPDASAQVSVVVKAGGNLYNVNQIDSMNHLSNTSAVPGFHAGVTFEIPISERVSFQPTILFTTKGYKSHIKGSIAGTNGDVIYFNNKTSMIPYYVEVPLNVVYKQRLGNNFAFIGAGPYIAYGLGGRWNNELSGTTQTTVKTKGTLQFLEDYGTGSASADVLPYSRRIDLGAGALLGYEFACRYSVQLGGQMGLLNLEPYRDGRRPVYASKLTYGLTLSLGYRL